MGDDDDARAPPSPPSASESHEPPVPPPPADEPSPRDTTEPQLQHEEAEEQAHLARDAVVKTTAHHQSDAEPMSAQSEGTASSDTIKTYVDLERVRIKMEVVRMRAAGPLREIPSGRVFDSPPGGAASEAIDGKTTKTEASTSVKRIQPDVHDTDHDEPVKKDSKPLAVDKSDLTESTKHNAKVCPRDGNVATAAVLSHSKIVTNTETDKITDKREIHQPNDSEVNGGDGIHNHAIPVDTTSQKEPEKKSHSFDMTLSDQLKATDAKSAADPITASHPAKHEATESETPPVQVKPHAISVDTRSSNRKVLKHRTVPDENRPLNEYLVSELQLLSSVMLGERAPSKASKRSSRAAHATTLQLYYDHTRALRDFDADWRRSHVGAKGSWTRPRTGNSPTSTAKDVTTNLSENPFTRRKAESSTTDWASIVESVRPFHTAAKAKQLKQKGESDDAPKLDRMYQRGLNGLVVTDTDRDQHRQKFGAFTIDLAQRQNIPGLHIVIASNSELLAWKSELTASDQVDVYPYWGEKGDREQILTTLSTESLSRQKVSPHVLLTSYDIFAEDVRALGIIQWQLAVVEIPEAVMYQEQLKAVWMQLLGLRARHRVVIAHEGFHIDTRRILQFLLPGLFSSRRKLLAWNCAAFDVDLIHRMCDTIESFAVMSDQRALQAFLATSTQYSIIKSDQELSTLSLLDRSGAFRRTISSRVKDEDVKPRESKSPKTRTGAAASLKIKTRRLSDDLSIQLAHKKRRGSDGTPRSRKRISRCGKCAGCLAEDCMTCGHCQDMKKYGGPGLRKQSCKNRKCINPRRWGMAVRKSKRAKLTKEQPGKDENDEGDEEAMSEKYETDLDGEEHDDGAASYYSQDSDRDSTFSASASHDVVNSDSDGHDFLRSSEDLPVSPRDVNLMSTEKLQDDDFESSHTNGSYSGFGSKSSRTRVMRCGKCAGCTASDCLTCLHCLDMKKYGGPGLRKQSCKNRKCIVPKVVLLNQSKDGEFVDEKGDVVHRDYYESSNVLDGAVLYHMNGNLSARTAMISLIQECEIFIDRHLVFTCDFCVARFSSRGLLELHVRVEHLPPDAESHCDALEKEASRMLLHPIQQNCFINAQLREKKKTLESCPRAYVKLEGTNFQYFMMQPYIVLGRLDSRWHDFYKNLGITSANGLAGGGVDCQIGDDDSISEKHALISWNFKAKHFTIECVSVEVPISVNDRRVCFEEEPLTLRSQDKVQVGPSSFFFLLPKVSSSDEEQLQLQTTKETLPRSEVQAWLNATMRKRRASANEKVDHSKKMVVAGIDIGSTHGCVGVFHNGKVNIIANDQGFRTTPAYVTFEGDEVIVGDTAVNKLSSHAENTIFHLKRVLGKNHEEIVDRDYIQEWSFKVAKSEDGAVHAATSRNGEAHHVTPVEFVSLLIKNLKDLAEDFTGESVDSVVLSIPAHATEKQKELLQAAADKAGVNVLTFISEPLAAAIAYGLDDSAKSAHPEYVLVFDIGGATHDVTLINADKGLFEIVATSGKDNLGGEDFTKALFEHCAKTFQRKTKLNVKDNKKASSRLRIACETAKRTLSTQAHVNIEIDSLMEGEDLSLKLTRPRFEELISDYVTSALKEVDALLESANIEKEDIDHVILVGGSSRIPLLQNAVKKHFDGKTTHLHLSPDEVVAHGATIEASLRADLANFESPKKPLNHVNVTPLTLSVALANGSVAEVIHRDTVLPATATETFTTSQDNQTAIFLQVYEGERVMAKDNTLLASLSVAGIAPAPKGEAEIEVTFTVSTKGVLTITAVEQAAGKKTLEVKNDPKRLTAKDVAAIIKKAEDAADEDDAYLDELEAAEEGDEEVEDVVVPGAAVLAPTEDLD